MDYAARINRFFERLEIGEYLEGGHRRETDASVIVDGVLIFLTPDVEAGRIAFWASLRGPGPDEADAASLCANLFNQRHFHEDGLSLGVGADGSAVIVGRSMQLDELEEQGLRDVLEQLSRMVPAAQSFLDDSLRELRVALFQDVRDAVERDAATLA